jgi:hypothetical protein
MITVLSPCAIDSSTMHRGHYARGQTPALALVKSLNNFKLVMGGSGAHGKWNQPLAVRSIQHPLPLGADSTPVKFKGRVESIVRLAG